MISKRHFGYEAFIIADTKCLFDKLRLKTLQDFYCAFIILCVGTKIIGVLSITQTLVTQLQQLRLNRWTPKSVGTGSPTLDSLVLHGSFRSMLHCIIHGEYGCSKIFFLFVSIECKLFIFYFFSTFTKELGLSGKIQKTQSVFASNFFQEKN